MPETRRRLRNPVRREAAGLLAKGGPHGPPRGVSTSAVRHRQRLAVEDEVTEYLEAREEVRLRIAKGDDESPFSAGGRKPLTDYSVPGPDTVFAEASVSTSSS